MSLFVPPAAQRKWAGISRQSAEEVAGLVEWAAGTDRPGRSFLACFSIDGEITAKRKQKKLTASKTPEEKKAYFAEITRKAEEQLATMTPLTRR